MKNKLIKGSLALAIAVSSVGVLTACTKDEVTDTTETIIDTTTSIIPVEYSRELAQGILSSSVANSLKETNVKSTYNEDVYNFAGIDVDMNLVATTIYVQQGDKITETFTLGDASNPNMMKGYTISIPETNTHKYYSLLEDAKIYDEVESNKYYAVGYDSNSSYASIYGRLYLSGAVVVGQDDGAYATKSLLNNVIGGRYFNGNTYISSRLEYDLVWSSEITQYRTVTAEYIIKDEKISSVRILNNLKAVNTDDGTLISEYNAITTIVYTYGGQTITDAPTSLNGYTQNDNAVVKIIG